MNKIFLLTASIIRAFDSEHYQDIMDENIDADIPNMDCAKVIIW